MRFSQKQLLKPKIVKKIIDILINLLLLFFVFSVEFYEPKGFQEWSQIIQNSATLVYQ